MRGVVRTTGAALLTATLAAPVAAAVKVKVDIGAQRMQVYVDGAIKHEWAVSTGRDGYETPTGSFRPQRLEEDWYSRKYDDAPMPNAIFFSGGYAIHGSSSTRSLVRRRALVDRWRGGV